ncbi:MAG: MEDS domain-containing protein [Nitrosopumilus sp.]|nr:MEDS domain-containing protein [Nitrosopumilus sp.]
MSSINLACKNDWLYNDPFIFVDNLEGNKHLVLFYRNQEYGQKIQFRFMKNGLLKGENCICTTYKNDISSIEKEMVDNNIDVKEFNKKGLLHLYQMPNLLKHPKGAIAATEGIINKMFSGLTPPFRLVTRFIGEINTKEQIATNLVLEQIIHSKFNKFQGLVLCHYDVNEILPHTHGLWLESILKNHHSAIFITQTDGEGIAFDIE